MARRRGRGHRGSIPISAPLGLAAFVGFLLLAVQLLVHAYATSTVTAATYDAARAAASAHSTAGVLGNGVDEAEERARGMLGPYGERARFDWSGSNGESVVLRVRVPGPHVLPAVLAERAGLGAVDRTVRIRVERLR